VELKNCKQCGKLFLYNGSQSVCPECFAKDEQEFETVKNYLWDHPKASLPQVVEGTGVKEEKILKYLREGRISLADGTEIGLECEFCGAKISYGKICAKCAKALETGIQKAGNKEEKMSDLGKAGKMFTEEMLKGRR